MGYIMLLFTYLIIGVGGVVHIVVKGLEKQLINKRKEVMTWDT